MLPTEKEIEMSFEEIMDTPPYEDIIKQQLAENDFVQLDSDIWSQTFENGEDVFVQKNERYWEVYYMNKQHQFSDEEMVEGLEIMRSGR